DRRSVTMIQQALELRVRNKGSTRSGFFPVVAGDKLFYRSYLGVEAVSLQTGNFEWLSMARASLNTIVKDVNKRADVDNCFTLYKNDGIPDIIFANSLAGTLSTDGVRVYAVDDLGLPPHPHVLRPGIWGDQISVAMSELANRSR